ncbi:MAG: thiamine pyrophosphate-dependent dehydrogenase E1 component subunit alpha [Actinomycetota bacterium]
MHSHVITQPLRIMGDGENVADGPLPQGLDAGTLLELWRSMVLLRTFDERAVSLQRQGRIGTYPMFSGEEATQAGPLLACDDRDWLFPSYRQNAIGILRGIPPSTIYKYRRGYGGPHGFWDPRLHRVAPICIPIATHLPHAVGLAWAAKLRRDPIAVLTWFGDGATSEGDFHEAMNFAAVFKAPVVMFCVNNQWAISTPVHRQMATETIVEKAAAYGMAGIMVDGFDAIACWRATVEALERARSGDGPTLIEAYCYRLGPHGTADDPSRYRDESETERWGALEPVARMASFLRRVGCLEESSEREAWTSARRTIAAAVAELESATPPSSDVLFDHVYASKLPWTLAEGRAAERRWRSDARP